MARFQGIDHPPRRRDHPAVEGGVRKTAGPAIEDLQHVDAGRDLSGEVIDRNRRDQIDELLEAFRIAIGPQPRIGLVGCATASHHVGRHRPRRAAEADQRRLLRQCTADHAHGFKHRLQARGDLVGVQAR